MSATWGNSENIYSLGVLPPVTLSRRHATDRASVARLGVALAAPEGRSPRLSLHDAPRDLGLRQAAHSIRAQRQFGVRLSPRGSDRVGEQSVDIAAWLHGLGLQQYEQAFRDERDRCAVLPELTADDLKDLGVSLVGHRRKLLAAIAALWRSGAGPVPETPAAAPTPNDGS